MPRIRIDLPLHCLATFTIPVRITDINYGNHLGNSALVEIIHEARMQFLCEYNYTEMAAAGTSLIMSELVVEFKNEAFYKDLLEVKLFTGEISKVAFELFYSISAKRNVEIILIAKAKTGMVCFNYNDKRVESIPMELKNILLT